MGSNLVPKEDERPWVPGWVGRRLGGGGAPCILHPRYSGFYALSSQLLSLISLPGNLKNNDGNAIGKGALFVNSISVLCKWFSRYRDPSRSYEENY